MAPLEPGKMVNDVATNRLLLRSKTHLAKRMLDKIALMYVVGDKRDFEFAYKQVAPPEQKCFLQMSFVGNYFVTETA